MAEIPLLPALTEIEEFFLSYVTEKPRERWTVGPDWSRRTNDSCKTHSLCSLFCVCCASFCVSAWVWRSPNLATLWKREFLLQEFQQKSQIWVLLDHLHHVPICVARNTPTVPGVRRAGGFVSPETRSLDCTWRRMSFTSVKSDCSYQRKG